MKYKNESFDYILEDILATKLQIQIMAYAEDEPEEERKGFMFNGHDLSKVPCFKNSFMYGIGSGTLVGVVYNLALSRNPFKLAFATYGVVTFGYFFVCRYNYRMSEAELKKIRHAMRQRPFIEGTEKDQEWAAEAINKKTEVRNFRTDIKTEDA